MNQTRLVQLRDAEMEGDPNHPVLSAVMHEVTPLRRGVCDLQRPKALFAPSHRSKGWPPAVFEPEDLVILRGAYDEACTFLGSDALSPAQRREIALAIILYARRGILDPHRLALKAIVAV